MSLISYSTCTFWTLVIIFYIAAALSRIDRVGGSCSIIYGYTLNTSRISISLLGLVVSLIALRAIWSIDLELISSSLFYIIR